MKEKKKEMTVNKLNDLKIPIFKVNPALDAYKNIPMFEDKIAEANEVLRTVGLPELPKKKKKMLGKKKKIKLITTR